MAVWEVFRHGGQRRHTWRRLYHGDDEEAARTVFNKELIDLRQGSVSMVQDGKPIDECVAGRNRTRW